jgi:hypothetical protein
VSRFAVRFRITSKRRGNGTIVVRTPIRYLDDGKITKRFQRLSAELLERRARLYRALAKRPSICRSNSRCLGNSRRSVEVFPV